MGVLRHRRPWANPQRLDLPVLQYLLFWPKEQTLDPRIEIPSNVVREQVVALYRAGAAWLYPAGAVRSPNIVNRTYRGSTYMQLTPEALEHHDVVEAMWAHTAAIPITMTIPSKGTTP